MKQSTSVCVQNKEVWRAANLFEGEKPSVSEARLHLYQSAFYQRKTLSVGLAVRGHRKQSITVMKLHELFKLCCKSPPFRNSSINTLWVPPHHDYAKFSSLLKGYFECHMRKMHVFVCVWASVWTWELFYQCKKESVSQMRLSSLLLGN